MSDEIPLEIQEEIIKRVPVKSLVRFRSVSKQWKYLIDSPEFIRDHNSVNQSQPHHLLARYTVASEDKYVSIVDDDSFPLHKFSPPLPPTIKLVRHGLVLGCSHGLVCLFVSPSRKLIVLWNPSIRKSVGVVLEYEPYAFGFGVCPETLDPKLVRITRWSKTHYEAEVFTLRLGTWRRVSLNNLPHKPTNFLDNAQVIDGVIYWVAFDLITKSGVESYSHRIISFDLTREEFGEQVYLPDVLAGRRHLDISKLNESLVVLDYRKGAVCDVWMMLTKSKSSFTKLFTVVNVCPNGIIGFRKNGQPIIDQIYLHGDCYSELQVYDPGLQQVNGLGIYGYLFNMASYTESLLLLNQSDSIIGYM